MQYFSSFLSRKNFTIKRHPLIIRPNEQGTVIGITQPPPREGVWSALFSNLAKPGLEIYVTKRSKRPLFVYDPQEQTICVKKQNKISFILKDTQFNTLQMSTYFQVLLPSFESITPCRIGDSQIENRCYLLEIQDRSFPEFQGRRKL